MSLKYIVLGFLKDQPSSGYDLNKHLQESAFHFWTSEQSQIYRALYKLRDLGWIDYEVVVQEHVPNKKVYEVTSSGEEAFQAWLESSVEDNNPNHTWMAQLYFTSIDEPDRVKEILQLRIDNRENWLENLRTNAQLQRDQPSDEIQALTLSYYIHLAEAELDWLRTTKANISSHV